MATKTGAGPKLSYDDFEPLCNWKDEEGHKTLVVNLPEFRKEELKVDITKRGTLKIYGERPVSETRSAFKKEIRVPSDCNGNEIQAKFVRGLLYIIMPKKSTSDMPWNCDFEAECSASRLKRFAKVAMSAAVVVVAMVSALGGYIMCKYRYSDVGN